MVELLLGGLDLWTSSAEFEVGGYYPAFHVVVPVWVSGVVGYVLASSIICEVAAYLVTVEPECSAGVFALTWSTFLTWLVWSGLTLESTCV